jgi:glycosyl transferase, family 25
MLRHIPPMQVSFHGDCTQANGVELPIVAVNLDRRPDKWQTLSERMAAVGLTKIVRASAVEGAKVPAAQVAALVRSPADVTAGGPSSHLTLTPPAIGCALSHLGIWRWMLGAGLPRLLVVEDDAMPMPSFNAERLRRVLAGLRPDMELVLLGYRIMAGLADRPRPGADVARIHYFNGTHAYLITPAGCRRLLQALLPLQAQLDHQISSVLMRSRDAFPAYYVAQPFFDCDWSFGSDLYIPAHHLSDESAADRELHEILHAGRRTLLAEGRPLLTERNE